MINARELRVGNYFKWGQFASMGHGFDLISLKNIVYYQLMDPIPLTEEWLLKFGFVYNGTMFSNSNDCVISPDFKELGIFIERHDDDVILDCPKYVHQLQNLYFALTGTELETK